MTSDKGCVEALPNVDTSSLVQLAIYLEGIKAGKGNLQPLGTIVLDELWNAIKVLNHMEKNKRNNTVNKPSEQRIPS